MIFLPEAYPKRAKICCYMVPITKVLKCAVFMVPSTKVAKYAQYCANTQRAKYGLPLKRQNMVFK